VISQITLINGEKIWVREERSGLGEDCNSSSDSINISVPLFVHRSDDRLLSYSSTCYEMMDLQTLLQPETSCTPLTSAPSAPASTVRLVSKPVSNHILVRERTQILLMESDQPSQPTATVKQLQQQQQPITAVSLLKTSSDSDSSVLSNSSSSSVGTSLLRSALMRKTNNNNESVEMFCFNNNNNSGSIILSNSSSNNNNSATVEAGNNNNNNNTIGESFLIPRLQDSSGPSDALIEEILMLAKKQTSSGIVPETVRIDLSNVPETLGTLLPVAATISGSGDDNNNINKSILTTVGPPASVISLVLESDIGGRTSASASADQNRNDRRKYLKRSKTTSTSTSTAAAAATASGAGAAAAATR